MLKAYLRGLLHPDLKMGLPSRIREIAVMDGITMEESSLLGSFETLTTAASVAPHMAAGSVQGFQTDLKTMLDNIRRLRFLNPETAEEELLKGSAGLIKVFQILDSSGILPKLVTDEKLEAMRQAAEDGDN